jgi:hypothetical protein
MFTNNKFKQLDAVAEMIKGIADADAKVKMDEMRGIIAGHNKLEVPATEQLNESDTSVKIDTPTGTRVLGHRYGNAAKTHRDSMSDPFALVKGPGQKDIEDLEKKKVKKEAVDPTDTTTDTLSGRTKGGAPNQHSSFKVKLKAEEMEKEELVGKQHKLDKNKNGKLDSQDFKMLRKEEEELEEAKFDPMKHIDKKNQTPAIKAAAKDVKRSSYADRVALMKAGGVKDDRGPRGVTQEEVEELDELSKSTLGSYAKKASRDAVITRKIGADFENQAKKARSPGMKAASDEISQKYKEKSWKRRDGVDKAVDRLTKEEVELDEAKSNYELYHSQYSGAIHHALAHHASKSGLSVSDDDYHHHVSIGPRKPTEGVSVSHSLPATDENGGKHMIHMQIYNRGGDKKPYELNTYSSKIAKTSGRTMKEDTIVEGSGPKEKQKSPYVDRNSTESKAKIQAARDKMAKDKAAEPGKKMLSKMKEDTQLDERELSPAEKDAVEVNVKSMKKNLAGFKARYGKDAKSVMYATATKQAKKD